MVCPIQLPSYAGLLIQNTLGTKSLSNVYQEETAHWHQNFAHDIIANKPIQFEGRINIRIDTIYERVAQQIMQEVSSV